MQGTKDNSEVAATAPGAAASTQLTASEVSAILAGLRLLQANLLHCCLPYRFRAILEEHGRASSLTVRGIDQLCEQLNCSQVTIR